MMKKVIVFGFMLVFSLTLFACSSDDSYDIVATMYTHYELSKEIVGDQMTVKMLVPIGEGIHDFEASSKDMVYIENAKLFLFTSLDIDTWITDPDTIGGEDTIVLNLSESIEAHEHETSAVSSVSHMSALHPLDEHDHEHGEDAHYWVDPMNAIEIAESILDAVISIDPDHQSIYTANAEALMSNIETTSADFITYLSGLNALPTIYVAGHNAFSLLGEHFGLDIESIFDEFEPDAVLTSSELIPFVEAVRAAETNFLFVEALEEPTAANAIKQYLEDNYDYDLTLLKLYAYQNVIQEDYNQQITYVELMERNINNLKQALGA